MKKSKFRVGNLVTFRGSIGNYFINNNANLPEKTRGIIVSKDISGNLKILILNNSSLPIRYGPWPFKGSQIDTVVKIFWWKFWRRG